MKLIIAGSRSIIDPFHVWDALEQSGYLHQITEIVSGCAAGVDTLGEQFAIEYKIPFTRHPAKWQKYGKVAGFVRNQQMGWYADALLAVWDGDSAGTKHMIGYMQRLKKPVYVHIVGGPPEGEIRKAAA